MMKSDLTKLLLAACIAMLSFAVSAQNENPFIGTWDLDKSGSNFGIAPVPENMSRTYQNLENGNYMFLVVTINADGSIGGSSATYRYDSQEYTMAGLGQASPTTISYRRLNDRTVEYTVRVNGRVSQIGAKSISSDGRVLTIAIQNINAQGENNNQIIVFNKRR